MTRIAKLLGDCNVPAPAAIGHRVVHDLVVLTGGIGEHDAIVRAAICGGLAWLGIDRDSAQSKGAIHVRTLPSQEDAEIARHTWELVAKAS